MTVVPKYAFLPGSEVTLFDRPMVVTGRSDEGYLMTGLEDHEVTVLSYDKFVEYVKLPGVKLNSALARTGGRLKQRLGGYKSVQALSQAQRSEAEVRLAICYALRVYLARERERGNISFELSNRKVDNEEVRKFIANYVTSVTGERVRLRPSRGGKSKDRILYRGRTMMDFFRIFEDLEPGENPLDALVPLDHEKGNRTRRFPDGLLDLMTEAWEKIGLDLRKRTVANVREHLKTSLEETNRKRSRNGLCPFPVPSEKSLCFHRDRLVTRSELVVATEGQRHARNKRGRGSTDVRALMIGELCGMDECKMSLVMCAKEAGYWETLGEDEKRACETADQYVRKRLHILVMLDVASRMPLAWVIAETPNTEATLQLLRMATRDKTKEKIRHGCKREPARAVGLMNVRNDNGTGLRNEKVISTLLGLGSINTIGRAYASTDRAHEERFFGTLETGFFRLLPGYTGGRPGELPGYDAQQNGVVCVDVLYGMLTRYFVDEYPYQRHFGVGMGGRRPYDVYKQINETRGQIPPTDPDKRRIQLGWQIDVTPTDEGVRVFTAIWFNSDALQRTREYAMADGKVAVFVDPDNLNDATVVLPRVKEPIAVQLQSTVFADMSLSEVLRLMASMRREDPAATEFNEEQLALARRRKYDDIDAIGVEHNLPRSYSTVEECKRMAKAVFSGARICSAPRLVGTAELEEITNSSASDGCFRIGHPKLIEGITEKEEAPGKVSVYNASLPETPAVRNSVAQIDESRTKLDSKPDLEPGSPRQGVLSRPNKLKGFE
ncbi:hypothetical protein DKT77_19310 [Meridianimarinicoccus roseus]|uniref:Integrase catalytic domain-containing protein n=1 Tax=Meridianimarinicoccus roseus TaxID=2072018 RepID=A0A2V2LBU5_9RHOB|nr:DDE-type integrase/transposase/recombinase [Meridianimarinicoccus roseus]PWR00994.1 hypothetical protein DKT77_19310 [Meridianimarinicoccus roseus]